MNIEQFANCSYKHLQDKTDISKSTWSKYFNSKISPSWRTINEVAEKLDMKPSDLVIAIEKKRKSTLKKCLA